MGAEIPAEAEMDPGKEAVPDIPPEVLAAQTDDCRIGAEQADRAVGCKLHHAADEQTKAHRNDDGIAQRLFCPVIFSGAHILGTECRNGGQQGIRHQKYEADHFFHNAHGCCRVQPPAVGDDGDDDKCHLNEAVLQRYRNTHL